MNRDDRLLPDWYCWHADEPPWLLEALNAREAAERYAAMKHVPSGKTITVVQTEDRTTFKVGVL